MLPLSQWLQAAISSVFLGRFQKTHLHLGPYLFPCLGLDKPVMPGQEIGVRGRGSRPGPVPGCERAPFLCPVQLLPRVTGPGAPVLVLGRGPHPVAERTVAPPGV